MECIVSFPSHFADAMHPANLLFVQYSIAHSRQRRQQRIQKKIKLIKDFNDATKTGDETHVIFQEDKKKREWYAGTVNSKGDSADELPYILVLNANRQYRQCVRFYSGRFLAGRQKIRVPKVDDPERDIPILSLISPIIDQVHWSGHACADARVGSSPRRMAPSYDFGISKVAETAPLFNSIHLNLHTIRELIISKQKDCNVFFLHFVQLSTRCIIPVSW